MGSEMCIRDRVMDSELCLDLGELVEDLNGLCGPVYEHTQPVYEP